MVLWSTQSPWSIDVLVLTHFLSRRKYVVRQHGIFFHLNERYKYFGVQVPVGYDIRWTTQGIPLTLYRYIYNINDNFIGSYYGMAQAVHGLATEADHGFALLHYVTWYWDYRTGRCSIEI